MKYKYFYSLSPRVFSNILDGFVRQKNKEEELFLWGVRKVAYATLLPHKSKSFTLTEQDIFMLPSEINKEAVAERELEQMAFEVEKDKEFWANYDINKKQNGSSAS